ncbi:ABC transporter substrate-binding protein [Roseococcus sp. SYP-B2431]|uniref:ABC transporter substrate-binding protein n=1 Tax=Roseococcus sp. SYP-B2431 TaxID=2496640 RepID=UPI0010395D0F|nr:ABC transporter substrate-binding protein [Roseococcus sp. SYP-B2431]TCH97918.1 ABC transporter substrate-binding protein [Roseococcus sp. SYP-B2431]
MAISRRNWLGATAALAPLLGAPFGRARAQGSAIRLGVMSDMAGPFQDLSGPGSIAAVRMAVQEIAGGDLRVEVVTADHQNRPDIATNIARQWFDRDGVDVIIDVPGSAAGLAVSSIAQEKNKVFLASSAGTAELTGARCSPNTVQWTYDTYMLANATGAATVRTGGDSWFFLVADYAFGHSLEAETSRFVQSAGGRVLGSARFPFPGTTDFSSFLLRAQASRAKVVGLAAGGSDLINMVKQAAEFGLARRGTRMCSLMMFITEVHALGLPSAQGLICAETFYWDLNDRTRAFTERFRAASRLGAPTMIHAGCYSGVVHYLKAARDMGVAAIRASGAEAVARMKAMPTDDDCFGAGTLRADGRKLHPAYLFEVKAPGESRGAWDYYKVLQTLSGEQAFRPLAEGGCRLIRS